MFKKLPQNITHSMRFFGVLDYTEFFKKEPPEDPLFFLKRYPTDVLIVFLAKLNALIFQHPGNPNEIDREAFSLIFNKMPTAFYERINEIYSSKRGESMVIFTSQTIVRLMAKLINAYQTLNPDLVDSEDFESRLQTEIFSTVLILNDYYYNRVNTDNLFTRQHLWNLELYQQEFARKRVDKYGAGPIKAFLFLEFAGQRFGKEVLQEFADEFNVASPYNFYLAFQHAIAESYRGYESDKCPRFSINDPYLERIIEAFCHHPAGGSTIPMGDETLAIISQPFYRCSYGVVVLDFDFLYYLTEVTFIYQFYNSTSLRKKNILKNTNTYLGIIGKEFYEEFLLFRLLQQIYTHPFDRLASEKEDALFPDALLRQNEKDIFVIEVKSARVHGRVLDQVDLKTFEEFIVKEFAQSKTSPGQKNKGIFQLKNQIAHLAKRGKKYRVFPIIVYLESSFDISGVNSLLDDQFSEIIEDQRAAFSKIYPLTLINLNFFIKYFINLKEHRYFMRDRIIDYHDRSKKKKKEAIKQEYPKKYFMSEYSFMRYIEQSKPAGDPLAYFQAVANHLRADR